MCESVLWICTFPHAVSSCLASATRSRVWPWARSRAAFYSRSRAVVVTASQHAVRGVPRHLRYDAHGIESTKRARTPSRGWHHWSNLGRQRGGVELGLVTPERIEDATQPAR